MVGERPEIEYPQGKKQLLHGKTSLGARKSILRDILHTLHSTVRNKCLIIIDGTICKFYFATCACLPLGTHTRQGGRCCSHTQGEIQSPLEPVGTLPLEVKSFRKPTKQKTPNPNGSVGMFSTGPGWKMLYCAMEIYNEERGGRGEVCCCQLSP